jgi:hypothetical protein
MNISKVAYYSRLSAGHAHVGDFEYFNFLHFEILRTREKSLPVQSGVVGVT